METDNLIIDFYVLQLQCSVRKSFLFSVGFLQNQQFCFHSLMMSRWNPDVRITCFCFLENVLISGPCDLTHWSRLVTLLLYVNNRKRVAFRACWESLLWWKQLLRQTLGMSNEFPPSVGLTSSSAAWVEKKRDLLVLTEIFWFHFCFLFRRRNESQNLCGEKWSNKTTCDFYTCWISK